MTTTTPPAAGSIVGHNLDLSGDQLYGRLMATFSQLDARGLADPMPRAGESTATPR